MMFVGCNNRMCNRRCLDLGQRRCGERSQLAAAPPDGVVSAGRAHVKQTFPLSRLADHTQLPVLTLPNKHLPQVDTRQTVYMSPWIWEQCQLWILSLTSQQCRPVLKPSLAMTQDQTSKRCGLFLQNCSFSPLFICFLSSDRMRKGYAVTGFNVTSSGNNEDTTRRQKSSHKSTTNVLP